MSNYFQILNRLEEKRTAGTGAESQIAEEPFNGTDPLPSPDPPQNVVAFPELLPAAEREGGFADLLDNLRARVTASESPCVVVAGITAHRSVDTVVSGLAAQAEQQGLHLLLGELCISQRRRILRPRGGGTTVAGDETLTSMLQQPLDCGGKSFSEILRKWSEQTGASHDLVVIAAPPLLASVETALLAKAGDGLVLVVHPFVTPRSALSSAVEKAAASGCPILGLVMDGTKGQLPGWLRMVIGA